MAGKKGRPAKYEPNERDRKKVRLAMIAGMTAEQAAEMVGVSKSTLYAHYKNDIQTAAREATAEVGGALYRNAMQGNVSAQIFWMKTRGKWRETDAALERRPYRVVLEADPEPARLRVVKDEDAAA